MSDIPAQRPWIGVHILIIKDNKVLLIHRQTNDTMRDMFAVPAGRVDKFETITTAGCRELEEETGLKVAADQLQLLGVFQRPKVDYKGDDTDMIEFIFCAKDVNGEPQNVEPDKHASVAFYPIDDLPEKVSQSSRLAIETYLSGNSRYLELNHYNDNSIMFERVLKPVTKNGLTP